MASRTNEHAVARFKRVNEDFAWAILKTRNELLALSASDDIPAKVREELHAFALFVDHVRDHPMMAECKESLEDIDATIRCEVEHDRHEAWNANQGSTTKGDPSAN